MPARRETWVWSLGWEDPLEKGMTTHSSILAWRIPVDRGAWRAIVCGVTKSWTRLSDWAHVASLGNFNLKKLCCCFSCQLLWSVLAFVFCIYYWAEAPILWPPDAKSWLTRKDPDARKDWRQEEKGMTVDEMVGWHHWLEGHEFEQAPGVGDGQGSLVCCSPWGHKESDTTKWLNSNVNFESACHVSDIQKHKGIWLRSDLICI